MTRNTRAAVDWGVMMEANAAKAASDDCGISRRAQGYQRKVDFIKDYEVIVVADRFNGNRPSELYAADHRALLDGPGALPRTRGGQEASRFLQTPAFDILLVNIAKDVARAKRDACTIKRFFVANTDDSTQRGSPWVSVVY